MEVFTAKHAEQTAKSIAAVQLENGMIPWFDDGHCDPWNHTECAMALDLVGEFDRAERAYEWLAATQLENGAWYQYYVRSFVEVDRLDANCVAYVATGVWHHYLCTSDEKFLEKMWQVVKPAIDFVLELQTERGEIIWARYSSGEPYSFSLLTASCSIYHSLKMAANIAKVVDEPMPNWELAAEILGKVILNQPEAFAPKKRWAMDWYYPVLSGVASGNRGLSHLEEKAEIFVDAARGVKCVSDRTWFTAAETAECAMAYLNVGELKRAEELFATTFLMRQKDGSYYTGYAYPNENGSRNKPVAFPANETSTYTASAVLLTADALALAESELVEISPSPAAAVFVSANEKVA